MSCKYAETKFSYMSEEELIGEVEVRMQAGTLDDLTIELASRLDKIVQDEHEVGDDT